MPLVTWPAAETHRATPKNQGRIAMRSSELACANGAFVMERQDVIRSVIEFG